MENTEPSGADDEQRYRGYRAPRLRGAQLVAAILLAGLALGLTVLSLLTLVTWPVAIVAWLALAFAMMAKPLVHSREPPRRW